MGARRSTEPPSYFSLLTSHYPPGSHPSLVPPPAVRVVLAEQAHLNPAACDMNEAAAAHVQSHMRHRSTLGGKRENVARLECIDAQVYFLARFGLLPAGSRKRDPVATVDVLDQP